MKDGNGNWHIKVKKMKNGWTEWLETESTGEKTIVFRNVYDDQNTARSEELVAWIWGEFDTEGEIFAFAKEKKMKAEYTL